MIFTETELKEVNLRLQGKKSNYKIWYRVKPKIEELLEVWFPKKKKLQKLIEKKMVGGFRKNVSLSK